MTEKRKPASSNSTKTLVRPINSSFRDKHTDPASDQAMRDALCSTTNSYAVEDVIEIWNPVGDPKATFPETYAKAESVIKYSTKLMDSGASRVMVSSTGNSEKGGRIYITPHAGNTGPVIFALNQIQRDLDAAGIKALPDPDYSCSNFANMSRGIYIEIPPRGR